MNGRLEVTRQRHAPTVRALKECAARVASPHERVIILVYDGPESVTRELSYFAPNQLHSDVKLVLETTAAQIGDGL